MTIPRAMLLMVLAAFFAPAPRAAAVSYYPLVHQEPGDETLAQPGQRIFLFHSGTGDVRRLLAVGEVLTVVRVLQTCETAEVGKVRALGFVGETYLEAEVVSGAVKPNDIARAGSAACLVLAAQPCGRE
jgi:hypothetical protein